MRLLITTQKVDKSDPVLGFFHAWIEEFAKHFEKVTVLCLEKGQYTLPKNVEVFSLGKESQKSTFESRASGRGKVKGQMLKRMKYSIRFLHYIVRMRKDYDMVFVHMNPEYVVFAGLLWRLLGKKIALWYVHRQVNLKLWIAEKLSHIIFSTSPEAFRLKSKKVHFVAHGIDFFSFPHKQNLSTLNVDRFRILHVGRITPIKNLDILIEAAHILKTKWSKPFEIKLLGSGTAPGDEAYAKKLSALVEQYGLEGEVSFLGTVPFPDAPVYFREADISVNLTPTGGMDKAVLESIASGTLALSANKAFKDLFGEYASYLLYNERDAEDTARKIMVIADMELSKKREMEDYLYAKVKKHFSLRVLVERIVQDFTIV